MPRRYRRHLFTAAAAVSLVLLAAAIALWWRGRSTGDTVIFTRVQPGPPRTTRFLQAWWSAGGVRVMLGTQTETQPLGESLPTWSHGSYDPGPSPYPISRPGDGVSRAAGGFEFFRLDFSALPTFQTSQWSVTVPIWSLALAFAVLPLLRLWAAARSLRARRHAAANRCRSCGYDLRASPDRCPECGTPVALADTNKGPG